MSATDKKLLPLAGSRGPCLHVCSQACFPEDSKWGINAIVSSINLHERWIEMTRNPLIPVRNGKKNAPMQNRVPAYQSLRPFLAERWWLVCPEAKSTSPSASPVKEVTSRNGPEPFNVCDRKFSKNVGRQHNYPFFKRNPEQKLNMKSNPTLKRTRARRRRLVFDGLSC